MPLLYDVSPESLLQRIYDSVEAFFFCVCFLAEQRELFALIEVAAADAEEADAARRVEVMIELLRDGVELAVAVRRAALSA